MKRITTALILALVAILLLPSSGFSEQSNRLALVIGNATYKSSPLRNPVNDAYDMAQTLRTLGFEVIHKENVGQRAMEKAVRDFGKRLRKGGVGLFYFAGHGIQVNGINYLIPIGAQIYEETDIKYEAVDARRILDAMHTAGNNLNIVILDACRDNPFARSFRTGARGLARMDAPTGTLVAYSTAPGMVAADGEGRNATYTKYLLKYMTTANLTIEQVLKKVRVEVISETGNKQVPWETSSLTGDFYFGSKRAIAIKKRPTATTQDSTELEKERERLEQERLELEQLKMEIERQKLEAERRRLEVEKGKLAIVKTPQGLMPNEVYRDGRFIAYDNGTVLDTGTGLMWAAKDNGEGITWDEAKRYCENYRGGGYTDWRMPTQSELASLYDPSKKNRFGCHITKLIDISMCLPWASERHGPWSAVFSFSSGDGIRYFSRLSPPATSRVLPVRSGN